MNRIGTVLTLGLRRQHVGLEHAGDGTRSFVAQPRPETQA
jgi:hypothetical protein